MDTAARCAISARRNEVARFTITVTGVDLTGAAMAMQIRSAPDTPGAPLIALATVDTLAAEGLKFDGVTIANGVPTSVIKGRINKETMTDPAKVPYAGEIGSNQTLAYAMQWTLNGDARTRLYGDFLVIASAFGSDNAPSNRPPNYGAGIINEGSSGGSLTFGDQIIRVSIDGADFIGRAEQTVREVAAQAEVSAIVAESLSGAVVALPVNGNVNELAARGSAPATNSNVDVLLIRTNTAETWLTIGGLRRRITDGGGNSIPAGGLTAGTIATLNVSPGGVFALSGTRALPGSPATIAGINARADAVARVAEQLAGAPLAYPVGSNANDLSVPNVAAPALNASFDTMLTTTNTGETFLTAGGVRLRVVDGGGNSIGAGGLVAGRVVTLNRSAGGGYVLTGSRSAGPVKNPNGSDDAAIADRPHGDITFAADGTRTIGTIERYVIVAGSSNAHPNYVPAAQLPANVAVAALNEFVPGEGVIYKGETVAEPGAPAVALAGQLAKSASYAAGTAKWVLLMFGMNECRTLFYHSQGGIRSQIAALRTQVAAMRAAGVEPVLNTIFPPDPRASGVALDPTWFADTAAFPAGGSTQAMDYPAFKAPPVNPDTQMTPPAALALTEARAWTGSGIKRKGYRRIWDWNRRVRRLAEELGCVLLDFHTAAYRHLFETIPDLGSGLDPFYNKADPLHPRPAFYEMVVTAVIREWALAVADGRGDRRVFAGEAQRFIDFDFTGGDAKGATISRAAGPWSQRSETGTLVIGTAANTARFDYDPPVENLLSYSDGSDGWIATDIGSAVNYTITDQSGVRKYQVPAMTSSQSAVDVYRAVGFADKTYSHEIRGEVGGEIVYVGIGSQDDNINYKTFKRLVLTTDFQRISLPANDVRQAIYIGSIGDPRSNQPKEALPAQTYYVRRRQLNRGPVALAYVETTGTPVYFPAVCRGLMQEPERTNLAYPSEDTGTLLKVFQAGTALIPTMVNNAAIAPDGLMTAEQYTFDRNGSGSGYYSFLQGTISGASPNQPLASSFFTKSVAADGARFDLRLESPQTAFSLTAGTSYKRQERTFAPNNATGYLTVGLDRNDLEVQPSDERAILLLWGFQFEVGATASSYIPTTTGPATRPTETLRLPCDAGAIGEIDLYYADGAFETRTGTVSGGILSLPASSTPRVISKARIRRAA